MEVKRDRLTGDDRVRSFVKTPNIGGKIKPKAIVIHYTAGVNADRVIKYFTNPRARASAHLVVGKDGNVTQMVEFDVKAWHAGRSYYDGKTKFNNFAIGIEVDNFGFLTKENNHYKTWFGETVNRDDVLFARHRNGGGVKAWEKYTSKQIKTVYDICKVLCKTYGIELIVGHEEISRGRKTDPGPGFPLEELRDYVFNRLERGFVNASVLNIRSSGSVQGRKLVEKGLKKGTKVEIIEEKGSWCKVYAEIVGWVYKKYVTQDNSDEEFDAEVNVDNLNIRDDASNRGEIITDPLAKGTKLDILDNENNWLQVRTKVEGWVSKKYIKKIND